jgi:hypothetical protein
MCLDGALLMVNSVEGDIFSIHPTTDLPSRPPVHND